MLELLLDLWYFVVKVVSSWAAFVTGGVFALAVFIYEKVRKERPIPRNVAVYGLTAFLVTSFFLAWHDEYNALKHANELKAKLELKVSQLERQVGSRCPPEGISPYAHDWFEVSGYEKALPESRTRPQSGKPPAAIKVSVDKGSVRFLDTGDRPTRFRGHRVAAGGHTWICGPSIPNVKFVGVGDPDEITVVQVEYYRPSE